MEGVANRTRSIPAEANPRTSHSSDPIVGDSLEVGDYRVVPTVLIPTHRRRANRYSAVDWPWTRTTMAGTMEAITWHGEQDVRVDEVPEPEI